MGNELNSTNATIPITSLRVSLDGGAMKKLARGPSKAHKYDNNGNNDKVDGMASATGRFPARTADAIKHRFLGRARVFYTTMVCVFAEGGIIGYDTPPHQDPKQEFFFLFKSKSILALRSLDTGEQLLRRNI